MIRGNKKRETKVKDVRESSANDRSEQEHRVVHVPRSLDHLHLDRFLFMAHRFISLWFLSWNRLDHCSFLPFLCKLSLSFF